MLSYRTLPSLLPLVLLLASCDGTISVTFSTGPQPFEVSTQSLGLSLPAELESADARIASVPCGPMGMCPSSEEVTITCEADVCDPAEKTVSVPVGNVIDVDDLLAETRDVGLRIVDAYEIVSVVYDVQTNTFTLPVEDIVIFWGPEAANAVDPALGVRRLGTVPRLEPGTTLNDGQVIIDADGAAQLSDYLVDGGSRIRFFAQTSADLDPGDPFPAGGVSLTVNATVRAVGSVFD